MSLTTAILTMTPALPGDCNASRMIREIEALDNCGFNIRDIDTVRCGRMDITVEAKSDCGTIYDEDGALALVCDLLAKRAVHVQDILIVPALSRFDEDHSCPLYESAV
jgi:hypothetical protein